MSTPTPALNLPLTIKKKEKKIEIIVVQCEKHYAILMCTCPVVLAVSLLALTSVGDVTLKKKLAIVTSYFSQIVTELHH